MYICIYIYLYTYILNILLLLLLIIIVIIVIILIMITLTIIHITMTTSAWGRVRGHALHHGSCIVYEYTIRYYNINYYHGPLNIALVVVLFKVVYAMLK